MSLSSVINSIKTMINYNKDEILNEKESFEKEHESMFEEIKIKTSSTVKPKEINKILGKNLQNSSYECFKELIYSAESFIKN